MDPDFPSDTELDAIALPIAGQLNDLQSQSAKALKDAANEKNQKPSTQIRP